MEPIERNPAFANKLIGASSLYLRQHAHNPVFWYPWGEEAISRARAENKPILLSVGYSTCYWCHVMEREVFENLSIASLMNRLFINIKVDREEHPAIDELYMVARQLMTHEGGWPNNVFLTPDLKPFYAGGTYGPEEIYGKPAFPRLLEWLHYSWTTQEQALRAQAEEVTKAMTPFVTFGSQHASHAEEPQEIASQARALLALLTKHHDERSGGFFQSPKFPHECYLQFLLAYHRYSSDVEALNIAAHSLGKMAAGGIFDHVGCGFHRYAVDKHWMVPHFEKMLYNQAMIARCYTDAFSATDNRYFADIACSILDFTSGPLTDGHGAFFSAMDAETDAVEGAFYAWRAEEIESLLTPEEAAFFGHFFALADIPAFPGHKHPDGQVILLRKPLDQAAVENHMPYDELAAMVALVMNKLLAARNKLLAPVVDDKIIVSWNGLMMDAYAHAGHVLGEPRYIEQAKNAANYLLQYAIDDASNLCRLIVAGKPQSAATLEDYAYLMRGLITLHRTTNDAAMLEAAQDLCARVREQFADASQPGYFSTTSDDTVLLRMKSYEDSTLPCPNAVMIENLLALAALTSQKDYRDEAEQMIDLFVRRRAQPQPESASMLAAALASLEPLTERAPLPAFDEVKYLKGERGGLQAELSLVPEDMLPGEKGELTLKIRIREGLSIQAAEGILPPLQPTQCDLQGAGVEIERIDYPPASESGAKPGSYSGEIAIRIRFSLSPQLPLRPRLKVRLHYQLCDASHCYPPENIALVI